MEIVDVVAALIRDGNRFMICKRPETKKRGGLWEFVGGKVEYGETHEKALVRECREELDIEVKVGNLFYDVIHEYPDIKIHLYLYNCTVSSGCPVLLEHSELKWIIPEEIPFYDFCPADDSVLEEIKKRSDDRKKELLPDGIYSEKMKMDLSKCLFDGRLSYSECAAIIMDVSCNAVNILDLGERRLMSRGLFWVMSKARYRFYDRPRLDSQLTVSTWAEQFRRPKCIRYTQISCGEKICVDAAVSWVVLDFMSKKAVLRPGIEFTSFPHNDRVLLSDASFPIKDDISLMKIKGYFTVDSGDIDMARHMNNVSYLRRLSSLFSTDEIEKRPLYEIDITYLSSALEGEKISVYEYDGEGYTDFVFIRPGGEKSALIRYTFLSVKTEKG